MLFLCIETLQNDQLCPDLLNMDNFNLNDPLFAKSSSRTITVNLPKHRISQSYPNKNQGDVPCNFKVKGPNNKITNVGIRGIHLSSNPWNFDLSDTCTSFIKVSPLHMQINFAFILLNFLQTYSIFMYLRNNEK